MPLWRGLPGSTDEFYPRLRSHLRERIVKERDGEPGFPTPGERNADSELVAEDEVDLHVLPRLLGDGTRLYDIADGSMPKLQNLGRR